jgi:hypothetical protein
VKRREAAIIGGVDLSALADQVLHDGPPPAPRGVVQRGAALPIVLNDSTPLLDELLDPA